jgi:hypothetical protein
MEGSQDCFILCCVQFWGAACGRSIQSTEGSVAGREVKQSWRFDERRRCNSEKLHLGGGGEYLEEVWKYLLPDLPGDCAILDQLSHLSQGGGGELDCIHLCLRLLHPPNIRTHIRYSGCEGRASIHTPVEL